MIVPARPRIGRLLANIAWPFGLLLAWDLAVALVYVVGRQNWIALDSLPMPLMGSALAIFVVFRNNAAYARWWEARTLWGGIVNNSRSLARQTHLHLPAIAAIRRPLVHLQIAYVHALRCHLRRQDPWTEIAPLLPDDAAPRIRGATNIPDAILRAIAGRLAALRQDAVIDSVQLSAFDTVLRELGNLQGGTERIKNTPLPRPYRFYMRLFVLVFCVLLPLSMVPDLRLFTPLGSAAVGFVFLALEVIGDDLEDPFENTINDVPMSAITRTIEIDLRASLDEDVPAPLRPVDGVLW